MQRTFQILSLFLLCVAAHAGALITATLTVTNAPSDGDTITVNGSARTWKNTVATPATQILIGASAGASATNAFSEFASYRFTTLALGFSSSNVITLRGLPDQSMTVAIAGTWGFYVLSTNATSDAAAVIVPGSSYATQSSATNIASLLALDLGGYSTNRLANGTKLLQGVMQTNQDQIVNGMKTFTGANVYSNDTQQIVGGSTTNLYLGATNAWLGDVAIYGNIGVTNTQPGLDFYDTDASTDEHFTRMYLRDGDFSLIFYDDSISTGQYGMSILRTGVVPTTVLFANGEVHVGGGIVTSNGLSVDGYTRFLRADNTSLTSSNNAAVSLGGKTFVRFSSGPTDAFNINGITGGTDGKTIILYNATAYQMTIYNDSGIDPVPANRIYTLAGSNIVCNAAILTYDASAARWIVVATPSITDVSAGGSSGTTINPTDAYLPYRSSGTGFGDSPLYRVSSTAVATDGALIFGPGVTNVLTRSGSTLVYTNGSTGGVRVNIVDGTAGTTGIQTDSSGGVGQSYYVGSNRAATLFGSSYVMTAGGSLGFSTGDPYTTAYSTQVKHEGLGIIGLNNGTTAQKLRIYSSTNSSTGDYERLSIEPVTSSSGSVFDTQAGGTGVYRDFNFNVGGTNRYNLGATGSLLISPKTTNNYVQIGATPGIAGYSYLDASGTLELGWNGSARTRLKPAGTTPQYLLDTASAVSDLTAAIQFKNLGTNRWSVTGNGSVNFGTISGETNAPVRINDKHDGTGLVLVATNYIPIEINGVVYKIGLVQ